MSCLKVLSEIDKGDYTYILAKSTYEVLESCYSVSIYDADMNRIESVYFNNESDARQGFDKILHKAM